jgi:2-alkyl-3-oxoalkanoate reductase
MTLSIAVTGASGFVGRTLMPFLANAGHRVSVLVRNPDASASANSVRVIKGNLQDVSALHDLTQNADVVLHIAGIVSGIQRSDFMTANFAGTLALAKAAKSNGVKRFVYVSSLAAREPSLNAYGESKAAAEQALLQMAGEMEVCIIRPAAVYGAGDKATLPLLQILMSHIALIPGTADAKFAMVHVDDVARALADAVRGPTGVFELHDGAGSHSWPEMIAISRQHFGTPTHAYYIPKALALALGYLGDAVARLRNRATLVNSGQIRQIYHADWCVKGVTWPLKNSISLQDGLPQTIRWYQAQGLLPQHGGGDRNTADSGTTG